MAAGIGGGSRLALRVPGIGGGSGLALRGALVGVVLLVGGLLVGAFAETALLAPARLLVGIGSAAIAEGAEDGGSPKVGDRAPDLVLADQHGKTFALGDVITTRAFVVIAFYPKAFTGG